MSMRSHWKQGLLSFILVFAIVLVLPGAARGEPASPGNGDAYGIERALSAYLALEQGALEKTYDAGKLAVYPEKERLLRYGNQLVPELEKLLSGQEYDYQRLGFATDMLGSIRTPQARQVLVQRAVNGARLPATAAALRQNQDTGMIRSLLDNLVNKDGSPNYAVQMYLSRMGDMAALESNQFYLAMESDDERRIQLISVLSGSEKGRALLMDDYRKLTDRQEKNLIISMLGSPIEITHWGSPPPDATRLTYWLREVAAKDGDASCRQEALAALYKAGDKTALAKLVKDTEEHGTFRENSFWGWNLLYTLNEQYPKSFVARGIAAYERVRGLEYFVVDRPSEDGIWWGYEYGDKQYNPEVEIPGFEAFLRDYPGHPATDSASYRLGRCYEIKGCYAEALNLLLAASQSPNGALKWDASQRVIFVADVVMSAEDAAKTLVDGRLNPELVPLVEYSYAVKLLRANQYAEADRLLTAFIDQYDGQDVYEQVTGWGPSQWDFWNKVRGQRDQARNLAYLQDVSNQKGEIGQDAQYKLAAAIYHDLYVYYNHFWQGGRNDYLWVGHIAETYDDSSEQAKIRRFLAGHNNYYQALNLFKAMQAQTGLSAGMREKVDYNVALCYIHLKYYGYEIRNLYSEGELDNLLVESLNAFIEKYPNSEMMAKALLALGLEEPNEKALQELIERYPDTGEAKKAREYLVKR